VQRHGRRRAYTCLCLPCGLVAALHSSLSRGRGDGGITAQKRRPFPVRRDRYPRSILAGGDERVPSANLSPFGDRHIVRAHHQDDRQERHVDVVLTYAGVCALHRQQLSGTYAIWPRSCSYLRQASSPPPAWSHDASFSQTSAVGHRRAGEKLFRGCCQDAIGRSGNPRCHCAVRGHRRS